MIGNIQKAFIPTFGSILLASSFLTSLATPYQAHANGQVELQPVVSQKSETEKEIRALKQRIDAAKIKLKQLNAEASQHERALAKAEKDLSESQRQERLLKNALGRLQQDIHKTQNEIAEKQVELETQKKWIAEQLQDTYKHGQDTSLKLVLSGESLSDTARLLKYHQKLHETRQSKVHEIERQEEHLNGLRNQQLENEIDLKQKQTSIEKIKSDQENIRAQLKRVNMQSQSSVKNTSLNLGKMQSQSKMLEALLDDIILQEELEKAKAKSTFSTRQGNLKLPMAGEVVNTYHQDKSVGQGQWKGIWIKPAKNGENEIKSIAEGHVVFADWLLGYGLITIIDHGHGFFSLYGQTQALLKQPGDWVKENETIALLNTDDMRTQPIKGLYFELRQNNDTLNPIAWLQKNR